ncbi:hypothetical protein GOP47_0001882, partial [Adiantum capillus-veneris]
MRTALFRMAPSGAVAVGAVSQEQKISSTLPQRRKLSVAVIGAGAGGLTATRELTPVVICNGHYFQPKLPLIPGIEKWPGTQLHSHNYRVPQPFVDQ